MADPKEFVAKTREQIRSDYTRTIAAGLVDRGIANPNVSEGTLDYLRGDALGAFGEEIGNLVEIKANAALPDSAGKEDVEELRRHARLVSLDLRPAGPSVGRLIIETSVDVAVNVPTGSQLIDDAGLTYEVTSPGPYDDGDPVPMRAVDTGEATNLEAGTTLRWLSPPPFVKQTATVGAGGLVGGVNEEDVEGLRSRVLDYYRYAPGGGNWAQVALEAEKSSTFVQKAFVYPAVYGGNTMHVCVVRAPTATNKSRAIPNSVIVEEVTPVVLAAFPGFADIAVTTAVNYPIDVSIKLALPASKRAVPPGPGGGWLDADPWPRPFTGSGFASVVSVTNAANFVVRANGTPVIGSRVAYMSPVDFVIYHGTVKSVSRDDAIGFPKDWRITLDVGFFSNRSTSTNIVVGDWIVPDAERMSAYFDAVLSMFARIGPAEKTLSPGLLPRALRKPSATTTAPIDVGSYALRQMVLAGEEVLDASFLVTPGAVPVVDGYKHAPNIATPRKVAFYSQET